MLQPHSPLKKMSYCRGLRRVVSTFVLGVLALTKEVVALAMIEGKIGGVCPSVTSTLTMVMMRMLLIVVGEEKRPLGV